MSNRVQTVFHVTGSILFVVVAACLVLITRTVTTVGTTLNTSLVQVGSTAQGLNTALVTVNRGCSPGPCGTLAEIDKLSTHTNDLIIQSQVAVKHADQVSLLEQTMLPVWNKKITDTLDGLDATIGTANTSLVQITRSTTGLLDTTNQTVAGVQPLVGRATLFVGDADTLVKSPQIPAILTSSQDILAQGAIIAKDAKVEEQRFVYPPATPWYKKIIPDTLKAGELVWDFER